MHILFFDDALTSSFLPLTYTRPVAALRFGIGTLDEEWSSLMSASTGFITTKYLEHKFRREAKEENTFINARLQPTVTLKKTIEQLDESMVLVWNDTLIAFKGGKELGEQWSYDMGIPEGFRMELLDEEPAMLQEVTDLFLKNDEALRNQFRQRTYGRISAAIDPTNTIIGDPSLVFIEEGAVVEGAWLNTKEGPIYIGQDAHVMEASVIYGPTSISEHATVKAGARIYGATSIGPWCKVGGEVSNCVFQGYSNKGHDGFLGNSVIGEWCNFGADSNASNLKNNYSNVKIWSYSSETYRNTGLTFCGLVMGDHSKCGINTMFNTGTIVGVSANIYGGNFPPKFIPSFSWGGAEGLATYDLEKALETARSVMSRRNLDLSDSEEMILRHIFSSTQRYRD